MTGGFLVKNGMLDPMAIVGKNLPSPKSYNCLLQAILDTSASINKNGKVIL
jgi:hypothetical protein